MIKNVSSTFKANCKKDSVKYREYIVIDNKEVDIKGNLTDTAYKDTTFFGKFNLKMLKFETENDIDYKKKEFTYYKEVDGEALKIGTFIVTNVSDSDTFESVNVTAYDYGLKFANPYTTKLNYSDGNVTLFQVIQEICTNCDVELENTSLPNGTFIVDSNQFVNGEQYGDVVAQASVINGMFATINSNDKLEFIFTNETNEIIEDYVELDDKRDTWPITSVLVATSEDLETAGAVKKDQSLIEQYGEHWLKIYSYGFAYSTIKCQQLVEAIFNQVKGFAYSSFKSEYSFLPYLSLGDKIKFKNKEGKLVDSVILRYETNYDEITLEAPSIISASVEYTLPETTDQKLDKVGIEVNQALKTIELLSEKIVDISAQASGQKEVKLENCSATPLYKLKITGDDSLLFPGDKKKHFTYETYEGSSIDVDIKGSSYDINNLEVKGRSTQEVRSGKNLLPSDLNTKTENGITITNNGNGTYTLNGTATSDVSIAINNDFISMSGTWKMLGCPSGGSSSTYMLSAYVGYWGAGSPNIDTGSGTNITYTGNVKVRFFIKSGTTCNNLLFKPMITTDTTLTYNDFEQYGVSPSPDYPSEIETIKGNIQIINTGKNLFDKDSEDVGHVYSSTGSYSASVLWNTSDWINVESNAQYTLSFKTTGTSNLFFSEFDKNKTFIQRTTTSILTPTNNTKYVRLSYKNDLGTYDIQIEKGSSSSSYEPYKSQTLNIDLQGNELCSIGDTKDILDISVTGDTEINKRIRKRIFNGTESWTLQSINSHDIANFQITLDDYVGGSNILAMCDTFSPQTSLIADTTNEGFHINASKILFIRIKKSRCSTVEEFKTWLSNHNVTVIYELATPETINLSSTNPLYLYDGINHLTNDNNADMVAKMVKSTMFLKTSDLYVNQGQSNEKKYDLKIPALRELNGVKDEYNLEDTKATLTKRIGLNANLEEYILTKPQIIDLGEITIELNEGTNILTMPSFPNNYYEVTYLLKNEYTDVFASQAELHSEINVTSDKIELLSKKKVNNDEIIASINLTPEKAQIDANKISLKGKEIDMTSDNININSTNFKVDKDGNLECTNAKVQGKIESNEGSVGGWIISNGSLNNGTNFVRANGFSNIYTMSDIFILQAYISEQSWAKQTIDSDQDLFNFYDVNHDGVIDIVDLLRMKKMIMGVES
ncbi:MAG: hypothetical protein PUJ51_01055 [Clostridiales bacterium]|uniref:hypothetical protein n=1 Tax=Terrisporobacter sp. TaxID=1965305 RepID=UPI002A54ACA9|nr:hypothetical protein [Terrisporobacter sp.]MDD7753079.1 hypothetical protein [Clostridiales bacterium]MDY4135490.1 hypothetical protein [Terrisporobacter sp.]